MLHIDQSSIKSIQRMQIRIKEMKSETKRGFSSHFPPLPFFTLSTWFTIFRKNLYVYLFTKRLFIKIYTAFFTVYTVNKEVTTFENIFKWRLQLAWVSYLSFSLVFLDIYITEFLEFFYLYMFHWDFEKQRERERKEKENREKWEREPESKRKCEKDRKRENER